MRCEEIRDVLSLYARAKLPGQERSAVAAHLCICPDCRHELERLRRVDVLIYQYLEQQPLRGFLDVHRAIEQRSVRHPLLTIGRVLARSGEFAVMVSLGAALVVLLVSVGILGLRLHGTSDMSPAASPIVVTGADSLQIEAISPAPGTTLKGSVSFKVQLGYHLVSAPLALLSVRIAGQPAHATRYFSWAVPVRAEEQHATVQFTMDAAYARELFGSKTVQLEAVLRTPPGSTSATLLREQQWANIHYQLP